ncbi:MAG: hypothetical protein LBM07_00680 [Culturomica sp.]|jgi:ATP-dependent DNA helicase RecG|nr:hypothetical protein [Culturomica sp.]
MEQNGSPTPTFETDDRHTHFLAVLPVHPEFLKENNEEPLVIEPSKLKSPKAMEILEFCKEPKSRKEILDMLEVFNHPKNIKPYIKPLVDLGYLAETDPDKPNSSKQKYYTTSEGLNYLSIVNIE